MRMSQKHFRTLAVLLLAYVITTAGWVRARWARRSAPRQPQTVVSSQRLLSVDQWRADIRTMVCAVRYLLEPERGGTNSAVVSSSATPTAPQRIGEAAVSTYPPALRHKTRGIASSPEAPRSPDV
jgi:hypothetical protein